MNDLKRLRNYFPDLALNAVMAVAVFAVIQYLVS